MISIITVIVSFILTGVVGNAIVQRWQYRNWTNQQRFLGEEKDYTALKELCDDLAKHTGTRLARMRRLQLILRNGSEQKVLERLSQYDSCVAEWNEKFSTFIVRLERYARGSGLSHTLEFDLQRDFVSAGQILENLTSKGLKKEKLDPSILGRLNRELNGLSNSVINFNRSLLIATQEHRQRVYAGISIDLHQGTLDQFDTWELFKALFHRGEQPYCVVRSSFDFARPFRGRI